MDGYTNRGRGAEVVRATSLLTIRSADDGERIIEGVASSASTDRFGDVVMPHGARYKLPLPLLQSHDHNAPIGAVIAAKAGPTGVWFRAQLARLDGTGALKERIDDAWQAIRAKLLTGVSIGFRPLRKEPLEGGGTRYLEWEWVELSLCTVPANADAEILEARGLTLAEQVVERTLREYRAANPLPERKPSVVVKL